MRRLAAVLALVVLASACGGGAGTTAPETSGASGVSDTQPEISRNQVFMPAVASFDGSYLWVGEFKFSSRLVRFSPTG